MDQVPEATGQGGEQEHSEKRWVEGINLQEGKKRRGGSKNLTTSLPQVIPIGGFNPSPKAKQDLLVLKSKNPFSILDV